MKGCVGRVLLGLWLWFSDVQQPRPGLEIRLILLLQMVESHEPVVDVRYGGSNTRTLYVNGYLDKAFPKSVPVPSMWTEEEKKLLNGTSLQVSSGMNSVQGR